MRIPSITLHASLAGATASPESTIVSITSDTGDVDVRQLPRMMRNAGYTPDPEVTSFLDTAEITTLEYVHSQSDCAEDASGDIFELDGDLDVNDPDAKYQKHLEWMDMSEVWKLARPHVTRTVKAAVIDTGVDWTDPDFAPLKGTLAKKSGGSLEGGWNFFTQSTDLTTKEPHGTEVSKILAAKGNNLVAGNRGEKASDKYPCWYGGPLGICVAMQTDDRSQAVLHPNSNWGERVDVAAYGTRVFSGRDESGKLRYLDGTSASAPIVAGLVAILLSMGVEPDSVKSLLLANADKLTSVRSGHSIWGGAINALRTVQDAISRLPLRPSELHSDDSFGVGN
ncbi:hypothetical protein FOZ60_016669 [Perkinsus olseni]|uniref:subtilisin n=1 Tax=Perkinsus olseni TaxID=32597 RepID=A0A7J6PKJ4_PEROL|nr:hypothetical protein FOZ60_016669 [Perkinsus olseni]